MTLPGFSEKGGEEPRSWVGYPSRRPTGCGMQSPSGPKVYPKWRRFTRLKRERPWVDCLVKANFAKFLRGSAHCRFRADLLREEEEEEEEEEFIQNRGGGGVHYQR